MELSKYRLRGPIEGFQKGSLKGPCLKGSILV